MNFCKKCFLKCFQTIFVSLILLTCLRWSHQTYDLPCKLNLAIIAFIFFIVIVHLEIFPYPKKPSFNVLSRFNLTIKSNWLCLSKFSMHIISKRILPPMSFEEYFEFLIESPKPCDSLNRVLMEMVYMFHLLSFFLY